MHILPLKTSILRRGDDIAHALAHAAPLHDGDIVVVSSKAIATVEDAMITLATITPSDDAKRWSALSGQDPRFTQAVLDEAARMNGTVESACPVALLTSLRPLGIPRGRILCPNAGLDRSNIEKGCAIGWPRDAATSADNLRRTLMERLGISLGVVISDSCCRPGRLGVTAFALAVAGMEPLKSRIGESDLFGSTLRVTQEAVADQLATAANAVMGNGAECTPAAIVRDHGIELVDTSGWVPGIEPSEDIFGEWGKSKK